MLDVNVRVSCLTLFGALVSTQAPLPEIQLLLQQPGSTSALNTPGVRTPQDLSHNWRHPPRKDEDASSPGGEVEGNPQGQCWLLQLCVSLVTQPREELYSDSDAAGSSGASLEPSPVRLEALQVSGLFVKVINATAFVLLDVIVFNCLPVVYLRFWLIWLRVTSHWLRRLCWSWGNSVLAVLQSKSHPCNFMALRYQIFVFVVSELVLTKANITIVFCS